MFSLLSSIVITNTIYLILGKSFKKQDNYNLKNFSETAILGFIYFSLIALIINFLVPLGILVNTLTLITIFIIFLIKKKRINRKEILFLTLTIFFCFFIILFDTVFRPDAGLYHLPFVKILNEEKIIFGLANLHSRFGHVSIIQYSSAINNNLLSGDIAILIPLASIYSFLTFYFIGDIFNFLLNKNKQNHNNLSILFSALVLIYISYKVNRYGEFGNDAIGHLLFFYLISKMINYEKHNLSNFKNIYLISVFTVLNKFTLIFSLLIPAYLFFKDKFSFKKVVLTIPTLLLILWITRNVIVSGCIIYPQINTCFTDLKWSNEKTIIHIGEVSEAWAKDWPNRDDKNISMKNYSKDFNWLKTWQNNHFEKISKTLIPYTIILLLIFLFFKFKNQNKNKFYFNSYNFKLPIIISFIGTIFFFLKFPIYRYGYSYLISFMILSTIFFLRFYDFNKVKKLCFFVIFIFLASFLYKQTDRYTEFYENRNPIPKIYNEEKTYKKIQINSGNFYNLSLNGSCMYDINLCTPYEDNNLTIKRIFSYKIFESK